MTDDLIDTLPAALHAHLDTLVAPPAELATVRARGRSLRSRRRLVAAAAGGAGAVVLAAGAVLLGHGSAPQPSTTGLDIASVGALDLTDGLRAYADPGHVVHLGGRTFPAGDVEAIDTDAAATSAGIVSYLEGRPVLLDGTGATRELEADAAPSSFAPTAKADSLTPEVAYGAVLDGEPTVVVRDLVTGEVVGRRVVDAATVIDAFDGGQVALRTEDGTSLWDLDSDATLPLGGPETRVADLRGGVLLFDGPRPTGAAVDTLRRLTPGAIDAHLTFDGEWVLSWSSTLRPTGDKPPLVLEEGPATPRDGYAFYSIDTDGSVLVADPGSKPVTVYDCEVPSGSCTELGPLTTRGGDPAFIGNDM